LSYGTISSFVLTGPVNEKIFLKKYKLKMACKIIYKIHTETPFAFMFFKLFHTTVHSDTKVN